VILGTAFVFGTLFGSFLNVVVYRVPLGVDIWQRSACPRCHARVRWYHNVPLVSWVWLRGRCADCGGPIAVRYPIVELVAGLVTAFAVWRWGLGWTAVSATVFAYVLLVLALIDVDHRILPNVITLPGTLVGLALSLVDPQIAWWDALLGAFLGGGVLYGVAWLYLKLRGIEGMGMGDVKMMLLVGAFVGWQGTFMTIFIGSLLGTVVGIAAIVLRGRDWGYALPFGTFLAVAAFLVDAWGPEIVHWYLHTLMGVA
jgi:leader peptidase (prepilin peptidase)/N-methyltransferase